MLRSQVYVFLLLKIFFFTEIDVCSFLHGMESCAIEMSIIIIVNLENTCKKPNPNQTKQTKNKNDNTFVAWNIDRTQIKLANYGNICIVSVFSG